MEKIDMEKGLEDLGLNNRETRLFLAALSLGIFTTNSLAEFSQQPRSSTYDIINSLMRKGFISSFKRESKTYYQAIEPKQITQIEEERIYNLKKLIPELEKIKKDSTSR